MNYHRGGLTFSHERPPPFGGCHSALIHEHRIARPAAEVLTPFPADIVATAGGPSATPETADHLAVISS